MLAGMLTITHGAAQLLANQRAESGAPDHYGVRLFALGDQPGGETDLIIAFVPKAFPGDQVNEQQGLTTYVAPGLARDLDKATLDATPINGVPPHLFLKR